MPSQFNATNGPRVQDAMRKFYELQVDKMRKQLAAVLEDKTQAQRLLATERQTHENTVTTLQTSYRRDAAQWKSDKAASEARIALLERRLVAEKASFVELRVSDALAQENTRLCAWIETLVRDVMSASTADAYFPRFRHFDWFLGHALSHGVTSIVDGKDEESTSEEINCWYGIALWAAVTGNT
ncbi:hypothetical protein DYB31_014591, partial [Aphanomyces astaci]